MVASARLAFSQAEVNLCQLGAECASIFAIFTRQAWNMALRAPLAEFRMPSAAGDWVAQGVRACVIAPAHAI